MASCDISKDLPKVQETETDGTIDTRLQLFPLLQTIIDTRHHIVFLPSEPGQSEYAFSQILAPYKNEQEICGGDQTFKYILGELIDNIYEHSSSVISTEDLSAVIQSRLEKRDREEIDLASCTRVDILYPNESRSRSYKIPKLKCCRSNHISKVEDISTPSRIHQVLRW